MEGQKQLEAAMDKYFVKESPLQIPENGRKAIADIAPILAIIGAVLSLLAAYSLWHSAHLVNRYADIVNSYAQIAGVKETVNHLGPAFYLALLVIVVQGAILAFAYPGLKAKSKKRGWDLLVLGSLISFVYGVVVAFTNYGGVSNIIGSLIGVVIALYIAAQIKGQYKDGKSVAHVATPATKAKTAKK